MAIVLEPSTIIDEAEQLRHRTARCIVPAVLACLENRFSPEAVAAMMDRKVDGLPTSLECEAAGGGVADSKEASHQALALASTARTTNCGGGGCLIGNNTANSCTNLSCVLPKAGEGAFSSFATFSFKSSNPLASCINLTDGPLCFATLTAKQQITSWALTGQLRTTIDAFYAVLDACTETFLLSAHHNDIVIECLIAPTSKFYQKQSQLYSGGMGQRAVEEAAFLRELLRIDPATSNEPFTVTTTTRKDNEDEDVEEQSEIDKRAAAAQTHPYHHWPNGGGGDRSFSEGALSVAYRAKLVALLEEEAIAMLGYRGDTDYLLNGIRNLGRAFAAEAKRWRNLNAKPPFPSRLSKKDERAIENETILSLFNRLLELGIFQRKGTANCVNDNDGDNDTPNEDMQQSSDGEGDNSIRYEDSFISQRGATKAESERRSSFDRYVNENGGDEDEAFAPLRQVSEIAHTKIRFATEWVDFYAVTAVARHCLLTPNTGTPLDRPFLTNKPKEGTPSSSGIPVWKRTLDEGERKGFLTVIGRYYGFEEDAARYVIQTNGAGSVPYFTPDSASSTFSLCSARSAVKVKREQESERKINKADGGKKGGDPDCEDHSNGHAAPCGRISFRTVVEEPRKVKTYHEQSKEIAQKMPSRVLIHDALKGKFCMLLGSLVSKLLLPDIASTRREMASRAAMHGAFTTPLSDEEGEEEEEGEKPEGSGPSEKNTDVNADGNNGSKLEKRRGDSVSVSSPSGVGLPPSPLSSSSPFSPRPPRGHEALQVTPAQVLVARRGVHLLISQYLKELLAFQLLKFDGEPASNEFIHSHTHSNAASTPSLRLDSMSALEAIVVHMASNVCDFFCELLVTFSSSYDAEVSPSSSMEAEDAFMSALRTGRGVHKSAERRVSKNRESEEKRQNPSDDDELSESTRDPHPNFETRRAKAFGCGTSEEEAFGGYALGPLLFKAFAETVFSIYAVVSGSPHATAEFMSKFGETEENPTSTAQQQQQQMSTSAAHEAAAESIFDRSDANTASSSVGGHDGDSKKKDNHARARHLTLSLAYTYDNITPAQRDKLTALAIVFPPHLHVFRLAEAAARSTHPKSKYLLRALIGDVGGEEGIMSYCFRDFAPHVRRLGSTCAPSAAAIETFVFNDESSLRVAAALFDGMNSSSAPPAANFVSIGSPASDSPTSFNSPSSSQGLSQETGGSSAASACNGTFTSLSTIVAGSVDGCISNWSNPFYVLDRLRALGVRRDSDGSAIMRSAPRFDLSLAARHGFPSAIRYFLHQELLVIRYRRHSTSTSYANLSSAAATARSNSNAAEKDNEGDDDDGTLGDDSTPPPSLEATTGAVNTDPADTETRTTANQALRLGAQNNSVDKQRINEEKDRSSTPTSSKEESGSRSTADDKSLVKDGGLKRRAPSFHEAASRWNSTDSNGLSSEVFASNERSMMYGGGGRSSTPSQQYHHMSVLRKERRRRTVLIRNVLGSLCLPINDPFSVGLETDTDDQENTQSQHDEEGKTAANENGEAVKSKQKSVPLESKYITNGALPPYKLLNDSEYFYASLYEIYDLLRVEWRLCPETEILPLFAEFFRVSKAGDYGGGGAGDKCTATTNTAAPSSLNPPSSARGCDQPAMTQDTTVTANPITSSFDFVRCYNGNRKARGGNGTFQETSRSSYAQSELALLSFAPNVRSTAIDAVLVSARRHRGALRINFPTPSAVASATTASPSDGTPAFSFSPQQRRMIRTINCMSALRYSYDVTVKPPSDDNNVADNNNNKNTDKQKNVPDSKRGEDKARQQCCVLS